MGVMMATEYISVFVQKCSTQRYQRTDLRGSELSFTILHRIPVFQIHRSPEPDLGTETANAVWLHEIRSD